jgi:hypothetical protein
MCMVLISLYLWKLYEISTSLKEIMIWKTTKLPKMCNKTSKCDSRKIFMTSVLPTYKKKVNLTNFEQLQFIPTIKKCFSTNCTYSCNVFWGINSLIVWYIIMLVPCTVKFAVCVFVSRTLEQGPPAAKEKHDIYSQNSFISIQFSIIWQFDKET